MNSDTKGRMFGLLVLGIVAICIGSGIFSGVSKAIESERWPRASAQIIESEVQRDASDVAPRYTPTVEFRYNVGDVSYTSHRIRFLMAPIYQHEAASSIQNGYSVGREVAIAYNPKNPADSVLEPGLPPGTTKQVLLALFLLGITGYIFYEIQNPQRRVLLRTFSEDLFDSREAADESDAA
jgi:hypothetical protein